MSGHRRLDLAKYVKVRRKQLLAYSRYKVTGDRSELAALTSTVSCRSCRACCVDFADTPVLPFESVEGLDVEIRDGRRFLRKKPNGECIHLQEGGCSVYEYRPSTCRVFDCRDFAVGGLSNPNLPQLNEAIAQWSVTEETADGRVRRRTP
jgi:Putative zinc- or iron-chelating domain